MTATIRGLSLTRPWPFAFKHGKLIENRNWWPSAAMVGQYVALHAAQSWDEGDREFIASKTGLIVPSRKECPHSQIFAVCRWQGEIVLDDLGLKFPAHVKVVSVPVGQEKWFFGPYGWVLTDYVELPEAVPCVGERGLWKLDARPGVLSTVREAYAAAMNARKLATAG
jgi:hypothetical protein